MLIRVWRRMGSKPDTVTAAVFNENGGTIGRSSECTLVLPDPGRYISRIQAEVSWSGREFLLVDRGVANPILKNGVALGTGKPVALRDGDELHVGDYLLRVEFPAPTAQPLDPLGNMIDGQAQYPAPPFGVGKPDQASVGGGIFPTSFNPLRGDAEPTVPSRASRQHFPAGLEFPREAERGIDEEWGLRHTSLDPLASNTPLGSPIAQPNTASGADALESLRSPHVVPSSPMENHAGEIYTPIHLPIGHSGTRQEYGSWGHHASSNTTIRLVKAGAAKAAAQPAQTTSIATNGTAINFQPKLVPSSSSRSQKSQLPTTQFATPEISAKSRSGTNEARELRDSLLKALLHGAELRELPRPVRNGSSTLRELNMPTMQRIGALLRLFSQGTIDLLAARATLKSEMRAQMTVISAQDNNPLKFSPDASEALGHLLALRRLSGFMEPETAVKDAFNDLVAHQLAVMAGMRAALHSLLQRFDPQLLEHRLANRKMLDTMLPMKRKARLWELFQDIFDDIAKEAEDDFDTLFGNEFKKAYETQIERLQAQDRAPK